MSIAITGNESKQARARLGLSQGIVARETGINRTYLSLFESGRYLLSDAELSDLRDFFEVNGFAFPACPAPDVRSADTSDRPQLEDSELGGVAPRFKDGFVIPPAASEEDVEDILSAYASNAQRLRAMLATPLKRGFLGFGTDWDDADERSDEALRLMARNWLLIEKLHGHAPVDEEASATLAQYVGEKLNRGANDS